jgi:hypothetical protein
MVLNQEQSQVVRRERALLGELQTLLGRLGAPDEDLDLLRTTLAQIEELFLLVVVGEFNAGKSAFLNAMLGNRLLEEGVLPTTAAIHLLRLAPKRAAAPPVTTPCSSNCRSNGCRRSIWSTRRAPTP